MPKNFFQDMVKVKNENREKLNRETPSSTRPLASKPPVSVPVQSSPSPDISVDEPAPAAIDSSFDTQPSTESRFASIYDTTEQPRERKRSKRGIWIVAIVAFLFCLFSISYLFLKAVITINPKAKDVTLNEHLSASLDAAGETLPFDMIVISEEENKTVQATEEKDVLQKATGVVLIYNAFSSAPQRLDIDTRLEGSNGKIYKTVKALVVPGMKGSDPGSVEVNIYGAEAGEEYNSGPLDFTIFGFKGTPKYSKFYARSKGPITGGFKGKAPVVTEADKQTAINDLKTSLEAKLFKKATDQIPSGFVLFKNGTFLNIDETNVDLASSKDKILPIRMKATLYGFLFDENKLTTKIAKDTVKDYDGSAVYIPHIRDLNFSLENKDSSSFGLVKNINFNLSGPAKIVWKLDENKLIADLVGKPKKNFSQILLQYPYVDTANLTLSPFWKRSLPDAAKDIHVIVNYPK